MYKVNVILIILLLSSISIFSQPIPQPTLAKDRLEGFEKRKKISGDHLLKNLEFRSVGPTIMGGRVTDLEVNPNKPSEFYVAYASGGLWWTNNNGQSYTSLFDNEMVMSIGDIAVDWNTGTIWIGSGENNSSRSSYSGIGMFKSTDSGKTWVHSGLIESHHIGRIVLHPKNPQILWVSAMGHLYTDNSDRGVYRSENGGESWEKVLFVDDKTGAIDLMLDPSNADVLYASMWQRERKAWDFTEAGPGSGIYKSIDGGKTWNVISSYDSGFPQGNAVGRIGLAMSYTNSNKIYALVDNQDARPDKKDKKKVLKAEDLREMDKKSFLSIEKDELKKYLEKNSFPKELTVDSIFSLVRAEVIQPSALADYIQDANKMLFDTEVKGAEVYLSEDGGKTWSRSHEDYLDDLVFTYGYYFGQIRCAPTDDEKIYITGVPILLSKDGGKSFKSINGRNQHVDHHALWVSPNDEGHIINGNDGGINISYDDGKNWLKVKSPPVGQFYTVNVDHAKPYNVYGGLQDNGVWVGPNHYKENSAWEGHGRYPYKHLMGGDGFKVEIDSRNNNTIYTGYQFGHYYRLKKSGGKRVYITPKHQLGERPLRFNWQTPIYLSRHNQDILYFGSNKFHRSMDRGNSYDLSSTDLTKGGKKGDVAYGTITSIHESPLRFGLIYLGTDDGLVYRSMDVGYTWERIDSGLPNDMWVTSVFASSHDTSRIFISLNAYRWDNFESMIYRSNNYGSSWDRIGINLPLEPVNVIKEDPINENILYVGTDNGLYISLDGGDNFMFMQNTIPAVAVHDLVVQTEKNHLVVGTHGRSIYIADVSHIQKLTNSVLQKGIHLFKISSLKYNEHWGKKWNNWKDVKSPEVKMALYTKNSGEHLMEVKTKNGLVVYSVLQYLDAGMNYKSYDLTVSEDKVSSYEKALKKEGSDGFELKKGDDLKQYLLPGTYSVQWTNSNENISESVKLTIDKPKEN